MTDYIIGIPLLILLLLALFLGIDSFIRCPQNVRLSDEWKSPEIRVISGVILFGKAFGNLCSGKGRFAENRLTLSA